MKIEEQNPHHVGLDGIANAISRHTADSPIEGNVLSTDAAHKILKPLHNTDRQRGHWYIEERPLKDATAVFMQEQDTISRLQIDEQIGYRQFRDVRNQTKLLLAIVAEANPGMTTERELAAFQAPIYEHLGAATIALIDQHRVGNPSMKAERKAAYASIMQVAETADLKFHEHPAADHSEELARLGRAVMAWAPPGKEGSATEYLAAPKHVQHDTHSHHVHHAHTSTADSANFNKLQQELSSMKRSVIPMLTQELQHVADLGHERSLRAAKKQSLPIAERAAAIETFAAALDRMTLDYSSYDFIQTEKLDPTKRAQILATIATLLPKADVENAYKDEPSDVRAVTDHALSRRTQGGGRHGAKSQTEVSQFLEAQPHLAHTLTSLRSLQDAVLEGEALDIRTSVANKSGQQEEVAPLASRLSKAFAELDRAGQDRSTLADSKAAIEDSRRQFAAKEKRR